jgi:hypothetical protein
MDTHLLVAVRTNSCDRTHSKLLIWNSSRSWNSVSRCCCRGLGGGARSGCFISRIGSGGGAATNHGGSWRRRGIDIYIRFIRHNLSGNKGSMVIWVFEYAEEGTCKTVISYL